MAISSKKREGLTLIEVLVAIFIMGIGTIAILTLFPLGVLRMADAIKDERSSNAVANAKAIANMLDLRHYQDNDYQQAFVNPDANVFSNAPSNQPSYPVFLDPIGYRSAFTPSDRSVAGAANCIPRRTLPFVNSDAVALRFFSILDDIQFDKVGLPENVVANPPTIGRDTRYSWAYMLRRPKTGDASVVEMSVVVYNERSTALTKTLSLPEHLFDETKCSFDFDEKLVTLTHGAFDPPPVKAGEWILDASHVKSGNAIVGMHANFYRVSEVNPISSVQTQLSVDVPFRDFPASGNQAGRVVILEGVSEVFEMGAGRLP